MTPPFSASIFNLSKDEKIKILLLIYTTSPLSPPPLVISDQSLIGVASQK